MLYTLAIGDKITIGNTGVCLRVKNLRFSKDPTLSIKQPDLDLSKISECDNSLTKQDNDEKLELGSNISELDIESSLHFHPAHRIIENFNETKLQKHRQIMHRLMKEEISTSIILEMSVEDDDEVVNPAYEHSKKKVVERFKPNHYAKCEVIKGGKIRRKEKILVEGKDIVQLANYKCIDSREVVDMNKAAEEVNL